MTEYSCCIARGGCRELDQPPTIEETLVTLAVDANLVGVELARALVPLVEAGKARRGNWTIICDELNIPEPLQQLATELWDDMGRESATDAQLLRCALRKLVRAVGASSAHVEDGLILGLGPSATAVCESPRLRGRYTLLDVAAACDFLRRLRDDVRLEWREGTPSLASARGRLVVGYGSVNLEPGPANPTLAVRVSRQDLLVATSDCARKDHRLLLEYFGGELTLASHKGCTAIPFERVDENAPIVARSLSGQALRRAAAAFEADMLELVVWGRWNGAGTVQVVETAADGCVLTVSIPGASYKELRHLTRTRSARAATTVAWTPPHCESHELEHELFWTVDVRGTGMSIPATCRNCKRRAKVGLDLRHILQCGLALDMRKLAFEFMSPSRYHTEIGARARARAALSEWIHCREERLLPLGPAEVCRVITWETATLTNDQRRAAQLGSSVATDPAERLLIGQLASALEDWRAERATVGLGPSQFELQVVALHDLAYFSPTAFAALLGIVLHEPSVSLVLDPELEAVFSQSA